MVKLKLQFFGHLMQRTDSLEKTLMLGKIEGRRRRGTNSTVSLSSQRHNEKLPEVKAQVEGTLGFLP